MARLNRTKLDRNEADMKIFALFLYYLNLSISTKNVVEIKKNKVGYNYVKIRRNFK